MSYSAVKRVPFLTSACEANHGTQIKISIILSGYNKAKTRHFYAFILLPKLAYLDFYKQYHYW